jgi:hypothetical protein
MAKARIGAPSEKKITLLPTSFLEPTFSVDERGF